MEKQKIKEIYQGETDRLSQELEVLRYQAHLTERQHNKDINFLGLINSKSISTKAKGISLTLEFCFNLFGILNFRACPYFNLDIIKGLMAVIIKVIKAKITNRDLMIKIIRD